MKRYIHLTIFLFLLSFTLFAQKVTVVDKSDLQPIPQVSIYNPQMT